MRMWSMCKSILIILKKKEEFYANFNMGSFCMEKFNFLT